MNTISPISTEILETARFIDKKKKYSPGLDLLARKINEYNDSQTRTKTHFIAKKTFARVAAAILLPANFLLGKMTLGTLSLTAGASATAFIATIYSLALLIPTIVITGMLLHYLYTSPVSLEAYKENHRLKFLNYLKNAFNNVDRTLNNTQSAFESYIYGFGLGLTVSQPREELRNQKNELFHLHRWLIEFVKQNNSKR